MSKAKCCFVLGTLLVLSVSASAYVRSSSGDKNNPTIRAWAPGSFPIKIQLNSGLGKEANIRIGSDARAAILNGFHAWERVSAATVRFAIGQDSQIASASSSDGVNLVTFADNPQNRDDAGDSIAVTLSLSRQSTGELVSGDIILNPAKAFSTNGDADAYDIQSVATHEIGHLLGLDHSAITSATMYPFTGPGELSGRTLDPDDRSGISASYPIATFAASTGRISGRVSIGPNPVFGAHVVAVDVGTGTVRVGAVSLGDGSYALVGLDPGTYRVFAEPLDGPVGEGNLNGIFDSTVKRDFRTSYRGGSSNPTTIAVAAGGDVRQADIDVGLSSPSMNVNRIGTAVPNSPGSFFLRNSPLPVPRAGTFQLAVGSDADNFASLATGIEISGPGLTFDFARRRILTGGAGSAFVGTVTVAPDAPQGPRNVTVRGASADEISIFTGGVIVVDQRKLIFPRIEESASVFTGLAISNPSVVSDAILTLELLDDAGNRATASGTVNPAARFLFANQQLAQFASEIFRLPGALTTGWAEVTVWDDTDAVGYFVSMNPSLTLFDGAGAASRGSRQLWFNALDKTGFTELNVVNPGGSPVTGTLTVYGENGAITARTNFTIAARGRLAATNRGRTLADFFPGTGFGGGGYVQVDATAEIVGSEFFGNTRHVAMLGARFPVDAATTLYSAQLAHGVGNYFTRIDVSNPNDVGTAVTFTANLVDVDTGQVTTRRVATRNLAARAKVSEDSASLFGLADPALGWIQAVSTQPVIGSVTFGDVGGRFETAVPMEATGRTKAIFSQVAHGAGSPFFTGIGILNPDVTRTARVTIDVFREDGSRSGTTTFALSPGQRLARTLDQFVPELAAGQVRGYIQVTSDLPVVTFELFGDSGNESLVGVPPQ